MEKNNRLIESLDNLCEAFYSVLNAIEEDDDNLNLICNEYPFDLSFDEMMHEVWNWRDAVKEKSTRDTYFSINECTEEELEQLREALFYNEEDDEDLLTEEEYAFIRNCKTPDDIPFELLEKFYGHISFVDEDFWCNC